VHQPHCPWHTSTCIIQGFLKSLWFTRSCEQPVPDHVVRVYFRFKDPMLQSFIWSARHRRSHSARRLTRSGVLSRPRSCSVQWRSNPRRFSYRRSRREPTGETCAPVEASRSNTDRGVSALELAPAEESCTYVSLLKTVLVVVYGPEFRAKSALLSACESEADPGTESSWVHVPTPHLVGAPCAIDSSMIHAPI
jgi:hypothetical protein